MWRHRLQHRQNEISIATECVPKEQCSVDISSTIDQTTMNISDDRNNVLTDDALFASSLVDSSDEFDLNVSDNTNNDLAIDTDDEDNMNEFILLNDINMQTKLFQSCPLSIREACLALIQLARRLNLDKSGIKVLLNDIRCLFPSNLKLPQTVQGLMKIIGFEYSNKVMYYCLECLCRFSSPEQKQCTDECKLNNTRRPFRNVIEVVTNDIRDEISLTAKRYINLINEYYQCSNTFLPCDVINGSIYERLKNKKQPQLTIALHTDGAPVTKMGGKSLWPIQATILEIPPPIRDYKSAVMIFGAWLGETHPNRELLWNNIVDQIQDLYENGIILKLNDHSKIKFNIRVQLVTFDLPALAHNCNIIQFNGYDACPFCKIHGYAIGTQIFYPFSRTPSTKKTDTDYLRLSTLDLPRFRSHGIKGPTPLTKIMLFPSQIAVDYMHLVCSGHFKTLIVYWNQLLLPDVFEQASNFLLSITLPHSFGYQFMPLVQFAKWKTKMFRDLLLYISPIFVIQFLPDELALHFLYYFVYIRALHFYQEKDELQDINHFFNYYYQCLSKYYGPKSELCTIHLHSHLLTQVQKHGSLSMTSCFPRESYIGTAIKWCKGKKYILEQFITWYKVDPSLYPDSTLNMVYLTQHQRFDDKYLNKSLVISLNERFIKCCNKQKIQLDARQQIKQYARYFRGLKAFHSLCYERGGNAISYWMSIKHDECPKNHGFCFGEVVFYFQVNNKHYAFVKLYKCLDKSLADGLSSVTVPKILLDRLNNYYYFFNDKTFVYKIVQMYVSPLSQRPQRTTAGQTSKYTDFSVVSFPQLKKHSIIKTSLINIDPLSPLGAQSGNIKAYGERKKLMIVKTGTRQEMEEVSSRFSKESGSEEIVIPERQCESPPINDTRYKKMDECTDEDYEEYIPTTHQTKITAREISTIEQMVANKTKTSAVPTLSASGFDDDGDDFKRIFSCSTPSSASRTNKRKKDEVNVSPISASSDSEQEGLIFFHLI
ncbi:unnamed protein product [Rotaria sp. Silwood2]|nr:unnamed protein product [Rotaria sp. Silwood2]CAF2752923.1 unnamed protein product [Rotaria sp. Silwood2]CAF3174497.1 unnamed protein product [Rotaria sp. Silwood2]